jgi:hypothetical protein
VEGEKEPQEGEGEARLAGRRGSEAVAEREEAADRLDELPRKLHRQRTRTR